MALLHLSLHPARPASAGTSAAPLVHQLRVRQAHANQRPAGTAPTTPTAPVQLMSRQSSHGGSGAMAAPRVLPRQLLLWTCTLLLLLIAACTPAGSHAATDDSARGAASGSRATAASPSPPPVASSYSAATARAAASGARGATSSAPQAPADQAATAQAQRKQTPTSATEATAPGTGTGARPQQQPRRSPQPSESNLPPDLHSKLPSTDGGDSSDALVSALPASSSILLVSVSLRGHLVPLARLASELVSRGFKVSLAVQDDGREYVNRTGARLLSLGRLPYSKAERRERLRHVCHDQSFLRGSIALVNDIYLPNSAPMYRALHALVARDRPALLVIDAATLGAIDVAHQFDIPYIINQPSLPIRLEHQPHFLGAFNAAGGVHGSGGGGNGGVNAPSLLSRAVDYLYPRLLAVALTPTLMDVNRARWSHELPLFHSPQHVHEAIPTQLAAPRVWSDADEQQERMVREHATLTPHLASIASLAPAAHASCEATMPGPAAILINTAFGFEHAYPLPQSVHLTGVLLPTSPIGDAHAAPSSSRDDLDDSPLAPGVLSFAALVSSLPASLRSWLGESSKPVLVVLFGAGSMAYLDGWQVKSLAAGMTDSRFRVLWSLRTDGKNALGAALPNSFRIKTNFDQLAVMAHPQVRLVVSPCGAATTHESLYFGKPLLCIPLFGDQLDVSQRVLDAGAGLRLDKLRLEVSDVSKHVLNLVRNQTFRNNARRVGRILRQAGGTRQAADVVAAVIHRNKFNLLPQPEQLKCWHQVYQLDLLCLLIALLLLAMLVVRCAALAIMALVAALRQRNDAKGMEETSTDGTKPDDSGAMDDSSSSSVRRWLDVRSLSQAAHFLWHLMATGGASGTVHSSASPVASGNSNGAKQLNGHSASFPASTNGHNSGGGSGRGSGSAATSRSRSASLDSSDSSNGRPRTASVDTASDDDAHEDN